jgi:general secretion pathway protein H
MPNKRRQSGFTLLEVMLVLALMGIAISIISFTNIGQDPSEKIEHESKRLQVVFDMASDFAVLNQMQLGLRLDEEKATYTFVYLNEDDEWLPIEGNKLFAEYVLPESFSVYLELEGLPWESEDSLFDQRVFDEELSVSNESVEIGNEEDIPPPPPQIFIMSSGDITPFELTIRYEEDFSDLEPLEYYLQGREYTPLLLKRDGELDEDGFDA